MKLAVEEHLERIGGCSVRLGFLCDSSPDSGRGFSGALWKLAGMPVIPLPAGGSSNLFAVQAGDLGPAFVETLQRCRQQVISLAHPKPLSFAHILRTFAARQGKSPIVIPIPWRLLWAPLRAVEAAGIRFRFRADNLVSLMNQNPHPDFKILDDWNIRLRPFADITGSNAHK